MSKETKRTLWIQEGHSPLLLVNVLICTKLALSLQYPISNSWRNRIDDPISPGVNETKAFWKLYMVPGAGHGGGGYGAAPSWNDIFEALVKWVEEGVEPGPLLGTRRPNNAWGWPERTRPLCPYPEVARYDGEGSIEDAGNFMCVPPIQVEIKPETLNIKSKGVFTAVITVPEGYSLRDWNIDILECEGAPAIGGNLSRSGYVAKFDRKDLVGVTPGDAVSMTVKGTFMHDGQEALIQASDTIRVIK